MSFEIDIAPNLGLAGRWIEEVVWVAVGGPQVVVVVVEGHQVLVMTLVPHLTRVAEFWLSLTTVEGEVEEEDKR